MAAVLDLPLEVLTCVCLHLDLRELIRIAETCKRFRHGDGGMETAELPTKSPVVAALRALAFSGGEPSPSTRPIGRSDSWVAYLARSARQRRCREAPTTAAGIHHSMLLGGDGQLLACGKGFAVGHGDAWSSYCEPTPVAAMARVRVRSVAAGPRHSLALTGDGRVNSWGRNAHGQLGHGDKLARPSPVLVEGLEGVRGIAAAFDRSLSLTLSRDVFSWGYSPLPDSQDLLRPIIVEGFGGVRVRRVCAGQGAAFCIGEDEQVFSWGVGKAGRLGHGDTQDQPSPKRVETLRGVRVSSVSAAGRHVLALTECGLVYAWGENFRRALLSNPHVERELLPTPVEALRGVRVGAVVAAGLCSCAVADTGEVWAWGVENVYIFPLGHSEQANCLLPKPIAALRGMQVDAVAASDKHVLALAVDRSVYAWGNKEAAAKGALGLGAAVRVAGEAVPTPQRVHARRVSCGL
jgi:alpha-tubulin suppressor-like RCC1 family protein